MFSFLNNSFLFICRFAANINAFNRLIKLSCCCNGSLSCSINTKQDYCSSSTENLTNIANTGKYTILKHKKLNAFWLNRKTSFAADIVHRSFNSPIACTNSDYEQQQNNSLWTSLFMNILSKEKPLCSIFEWVFHP